MIKQFLQNVCFCIDVDKTLEVKGDRVVEPYSNVTAATAAAGIPLGRRGSIEATSYRGANHVSSVPIDPAHLTSLDLEDQRHEAMLVTNDAQQHPPHIDYKFQNGFNNNNNNITKNCQNVTASGSKYLVDSVESPIAGHENLAFDGYGAYEEDDLFNPLSESCFCDPGYGSDRSEEYDDQDGEEKGDDQTIYGLDYGSDFLKGPQKDLTLSLPEGVTTLDYLVNVCPFINEASVFDVIIVKNLRGLGLAVTGGIECQTQWPGLIRIKKIYPQTPAWLCGQLKVDDYLLEANQKTLLGLTSHEALEVLRTAGTEVSLVVSRTPEGPFEGGGLAPPPESSRDVPHVEGSLTAPQSVPSHHLSLSPSFSACGEFEIQLTKIGGSLGFTLRKQDNSILGHTIRSLVKEPAISDGRMRPGDKLLSVNGTDMCGLSHEEAVKFLRKCPETVIIRLYRDAMQTPISPASPVESEFLYKPKQLRKEARDMLTDLAFRKQSPNLSGSMSGDRPGTPRRRKLTKTPSPDIKAVAADRWESLVKEAEDDDPLAKRLSEGNCYNSSAKAIEESSASHLPMNGASRDSFSLCSSHLSRNSSDSSSVTPTSHTSETRPKRPTFLDLNTNKSSLRKSQFTPPHEEVDFPSSPLMQDSSTSEESRLSSLQESKEVTSAPLSSTQSDNFSHFQPGYHSVNLGTLPSQAKQRLTNTSSDHDLNSHLNGDFASDKNSTLLKWKGVTFTPENDDQEQDDGSMISTPLPYNSLNEYLYSPTNLTKPKILTIEMTRGWNSRLGFSLQPQDGKTVIVAIYADSVAAKDGRLQVGDQILEVNNNDVMEWTTDDVIDLLRKTKGKIILKVLQND